MDDTATETTATETKTETETKPNAEKRIEDLVAENKALTEKNEVMQQNQAVLSANVQAPEPAKQYDPWEASGMDPKEPNEPATQEQHKKILGHYVGGLQEEAALTRFVADHPDFPQIVGTAQQIASGQLAEPIMKAIKADPTLYDRLKNSRTRLASYKAAYSVAKIQSKKEVKATTKTEAQEAIDDAVDNATKVKSVSNTKGGAALSEEGPTAKLSDADFINLFNQSGGDL